MADALRVPLPGLTHRANEPPIPPQQGVAEGDEAAVRGGTGSDALAGEGEGAAGGRVGV